MHPLFMENLAYCPGCNHAENDFFLECEDWLVSHEKFKLVRCRQCQLVFTNPRPDEQEVGRYYQSEDYISHSNTSQGAMASAYQAVRSLMLGRKARLVEKLQPNKGLLLDVGCATGHFLQVVRRRGWQVQGTEPSAEARQQAFAKGIEVVPDVFSMPEKENVQVITMWHVLEHVHRLQGTLAHLFAMLAPGGHLVIAVPNHFSADARHYGKDWAAYDVPRHLYHFNPDTLRATVVRQGFTYIKQQAMPADAFYVSLLSEKNRGGSPAAALAMGTRSNLKAMQTGQYSSLTYIFQKKG